MHRWHGMLLGGSLWFQYFDMSGSLEHSDMRQGVVLYKQKRLTSLVQNLEIVDMTALLKFTHAHVQLQQPKDYAPF